MNVRPSKIVGAISAVLVVALVATLVALSQGYPTRKLDLNDSGIWVTNDEQLNFGRVNQSADGLDAWLDAPGGTAKRELDLFQDGNAAVQFDAISSVVVPINTSKVINVNEATRVLKPSSLVDMRGGTIAAIDPGTGKVYATRYDPRQPEVAVQALDPEADPLLELGAAPEGSARPAAIAVGVDGAVHVVLANGKMATVPAAEGGFGKPVLSEVSQGLTGVQIAAVGEKPVVYDAASGLVVLPDGKSKQVDADAGGLLQASSDEADGVLIALSTGLLRISLTEGVLAELTKSVSGNPAVPVHVGGCDFGAWAGGTGSVVRSCGTPEAEERAKIRDAGALIRPVFRVNRGRVILNDAANGRAFDLATQNRLDRWDDIKPKAGEQSQNPTQTVKPSRKEAKPVANPDEVGVRAGAVATGYLLDNDTDALGQILMITAVKNVPRGASVTIAPDGQTVAVRAPAGSNGFNFSYEISNGVNGSASTVAVKVVHDEGSNRAPHLRPGYTDESYAVASYGTLALSVLGDWRDRDGDAVTVLSADMNGEPVPVTPEGRIEYVAGGEETRVTKTLTYRVSDGRRMDVVERKLPITIYEKSSLTGTSPIAMPDSVRGEVGKALTFNPLANDIPGSDPRTPDAKLRLGAPLKQVPGLSISSDTSSGQVTVTAAAAGSHELSYTAAFGSSTMQPGKIRLDIVPATTGQAPVAMPDTVTMRGRVPVRLDPLPNDFDPDGGILTVTGVETDASGLSAAVVSGRWVLISAESSLSVATSFTLTYTVTNGTASTKGQITLIRLPEIPDAQPIVKDDLAVVRANDSGSINALGNDVAVNGEQLTLVSNVVGQETAGELVVYDPSVVAGASADVGRAYVHNNRIRYVAPAKVDKEKQFVIEYYAQNAAGKRSATGNVRVTVRPEPVTPEDNRAPVPEPIEARVNAGQRMKISIPSTSQDPDGDSVMVTSLGSAPKLGRIVGISPTGITYEAFPFESNSGTDTFTILVADKYGKAAPAVVRVGVTPPGAAQVPIAVDDVVTAQPGALVRADALANDLFSRADSVELAPLADLNDQLPAEVKAESPTGPISVQAPTANGQPVLVQYALQGNGGTSTPATIKVVSQEGYRNPPVIFDEVAKAEGQVGKADLLARAWDPDGADAKLTVTLLGGPEGATLDGGKLSVPLTGQPQIIPFRVTDESGAASAAVVFVPSSGTAAPHLKAGGLIQLDANSSVTLKLDDYVFSPRELSIQFTPDSAFSGAPAGKVDVEATGPTTFRVTSKDGYVGPGAVTFEVMDAPSRTADGVMAAYVSIPVQVGPNTPVLRCPETSVELMQGGADRTLDIASLCHVWAPNPDDIDSMVFTAEWQGSSLDDVRVSNGHRLTFRAGVSAVPDQRGVIMVGVQGSQAIKQPVNLRVLKTAPPTMASQTFADIKQGTPVRIPLGIRSPMRDAKPRVVRVDQASGDTAQVAVAGTTLTITPGSSSHGRMVFQVVASDVPSDDREDRQVSATITLDVYGIAEAPSTPQPGQRAQSKAENLSWSVPVDNGAPIQYYVVSSDLGKTYRCPTNTCRIEGLTNAVPVKFKVRAFNRAGLGKESDWSRAITPDQPPPAPTGLRVSNPQDRMVTLSWNPVVFEGTAVKKFHIIVNGKHYEEPGSALSAQVPMPDNNNVYEITLLAENEYDKGPSTKILGQSAGRPIGLQAPTFQPASATGAATAVTLNWNTPDKNGPADLTYRVVRDGSKVICSGVLGTSCVDDLVTYDGSTHSYQVTATNGAGKPEHSASVTGSWTAVGVPERPSAPSATATGANNQIRVSGTVPDSRGKTSRIVIRSNGTQVGQQSGLNARGGQQFVVNVSVPSNGTAYNITFEVCNEQRCGQQSPASSASAYGPIGGLTISARAAGTETYYTASVNPNGKAVNLVVNGRTFRTDARVGTWSTGEVGETVGYSQTRTYSASANDVSPGPGPARSAGPKSASATTGPKPPDPSIRIFGQGSAMGQPNCGSPLCHYVYVTTKDFPGPVTCQLTHYYDGSWKRLTDITGTWTQGPNETKAARSYYFGYPGIRGVCGGTTGENRNWPN